MKLSTPVTRFLDIQGASQYPGISVTTLYKWISQRKIPHIKMGRLLKFDPLKLDEWIRQQTIMPMPRRSLGRNGIGSRMVADRFRNRRIDWNEFRQVEGFQRMSDHGGRSHDTETHLINMQSVVPRKKVAHSAKVHGGHFGKIEDDVATGSLLGLLNNFFKPQGVKGIQMPGKGQYSSGRMIGAVEFLHKGFIGKKDERVKGLFGKRQLMDGRSVHN